MQYSKTLGMLALRALYHERQLALVRQALNSLGDGSSLDIVNPDIVFEIHVQADAPSQVSVMVQGRDLTKTLERMETVWEEKNPSSVIGNRLELFLRVGDIRIAVDPEDAGGIRFSLDTRISQGVNPMVFRDGDKLPSSHYARHPTATAP